MLRVPDRAFDLRYACYIWSGNYGCGGRRERDANRRDSVFFGETFPIDDGKTCRSWSGGTYPAFNLADFCPGARRIRRCLVSQRRNVLGDAKDNCGFDSLVSRFLSARILCFRDNFRLDRFDGYYSSRRKSVCISSGNDFARGILLRVSGFARSELRFCVLGFNRSFRITDRDADKGRTRDATSLANTFIGDGESPDDLISRLDCFKGLSNRNVDVWKTRDYS